jgi:NAD(P)-dependent dehydrogenase (short-subunit alcohol dehydrogenase family)
LDGLVVRGSVTEAGDRERPVTACRERYGRIDAGVNRAGDPPEGPPLEIADRDGPAGLDMPVLNAVRVCRLAPPATAAHGWPVVLGNR